MTIRRILTEKQKEQAKEYLRQWRAANRERIAKSQHQWYVANRERVKIASRKYYAAHKDKKCEASRKWRAANPERAREYNSQWRADNPETGRRWVAANLDKRCASAHKRRALVTGNGGSHTAEEFLALCAQYGNKCIGPGPHKGKLEADHVIPVSKPGGTSNITNIQPLCGLCNRRKGTKTTDYRSME